MKKGVSLTILIVTVMVLVIVTGTLIVNTNSDKNIIDETTQIINQNNKKVIIQEIQNKLQIKRIENSNKGIYNVGVEEYVIPILQQYGTFDRGSFRLVTNKDNIVIYLDEIIKIPLKEYVQVEYENNVLKITTELTDKGYTVEYATSKDGIWQEYVSEVDVETDEGIYVRLKNNNDKIVSSIVKVYNN